MAAGSAVAADQPLPATEPPVPFAPRLVTSLEGDYLKGHYDTGNAFSAHQFDSRAANVFLGVDFGRYLLLGLRYQEAWTHVNMSLVSQSQKTQSQSWGLRAAVKLDPFVWDTTVSSGIDHNAISIIDPTGFFPPMNATWSGREWAVDSALSARLALGAVVFEPLGGVRTVKLHDDGYTTDGIIAAMLPPQSRSDTSLRAKATLSVPVQLDQFGTFTPWIAGELRRSRNPHPPIGVLTDLTGMAGGHYILNLPFLESPTPFPAQTWRSLSGGLRLDVSPSFYLAATGEWSVNALGHWEGYKVSATVKF
jgi:hypothetical protein